MSNEQVRQKAVSLAVNYKESGYLLGLELVVIRDGKLYLEWGFKTMKSWMVKEIESNMSHAKACGLERVARKLKTLFKGSRLDKVKRICSPSKVEVICRLDPKRDRDKMLGLFEKAEKGEITRNLLEEVRVYLGKPYNARMIFIGSPQEVKFCNSVLDASGRESGARSRIDQLAYCLKEFSLARKKKVA